MVFEVLRITPKLQIANAELGPGSLLEGKLYVTCTAKEPVTVKEIWINFAGAATLNGNVSHRRARRIHAAAGSSGLSVSGAVDGGAVVDGSVADGAVVDSASIDSANTYTTVEERDSASLALARTSVCLRAEPSEFAPGVHTIPFAIVLPREHNGVPLPPSFNAPELGLRARYSVSAQLKLAPLLSRKDKQSVTLVSAGVLSALEPPPRLKLSVGTWTYPSTRLWPAIKYYLGVNTADSMRDVVVTIGMRDVGLASTEATYLQDVLQLTVEPAGEPASAPAGELTDKFVDNPVDNKSTDKFVDNPVDNPVDNKSTDKFVDNPVDNKLTDKFVDNPVDNKLTDNSVDSSAAKSAANSAADSAPAGLPLLVDCLRVELRSEVFDRSKGLLASRHRYRILNARHLDFPVEFTSAADGKVDITAIVSGARLPADVAPTLNWPRLQVQHWLVVRIGLRSSSPDGTRQAVAHKEIQLPIRLATK